jgi:DNA-binding transcriptional ArsR family regulator
MPYQLKVVYSPVFELITSLKLFLDKQTLRATDLGKAWVNEVDQQLEPGLKRTLSQLMESSEDAFWDKKLFELFLFKFSLSIPHQMSINAYLKWFRQQSPEDLYREVDWGEWGRLPMDEWKEMKRQVVAVVEQWHQQYFRHIDPERLQLLQQDAEEKRRLAEHMDVIDVVEQATKGIRLRPIDDAYTITLIPQYHSAPANLLQQASNQQIIWGYAVEIPPATPDEPPRSLVRFNSSLGDVNRLRILRYIAAAPRTFMEIVRHIGLAKSTVNHHLVQLRAAGLVQLDFHVDQGTGLHRLRERVLDQVGSQLRAYLKGENM